MRNLKITWLCQAGFLLEADGKRIVVDPYMSNRLYEVSRKDVQMNRMMPNPVPYEELRPDLVCFTHDHADHYDPESVREIIGVCPDCKFAGPTSTLNHFEKDGYNKSNFTKLDIGDVFEDDTFKITAVSAYHSDPLAVGYVFEIAGKKLYISGDSLYQPTLSADVKKVCGAPDIVCICINGKLGNMPWEDAVKVVEELKPKFAIPMHYGLFARNTEDPRPFMAAVEKLGVETEEPSVKGRVF